MQGAPGPLTHSVVDRLEGYFRQSGGLNQISVGENTNSLRTGNALAQMGAMSIDPRIQEAQRLMTRGLKVVNEAIVGVEKGYFPNHKAVFFSGWPGDFGHVEYTPAKDFDSSENVVTYPFPGTDINQLTVAIGQAVGTGIIPKKTGRAHHPLSQNPEADERQIVAEQLMEAGLGGLMQQAAQGAIPLVDLMAIAENYTKSGDLADAVRKADEAARARQATPAPASAPASQAGLALPGQGAESQVDEASPIPGAQQGSLDFASLVNALQASPPPPASVPA